jgi:hypothetical protein
MLITVDRAFSLEFMEELLSVSASSGNRVIDWENCAVGLESTLEIMTSDSRAMRVFFTVGREVKIMFHTVSYV